jgi:hypothetical protein
LHGGGNDQIPDVVEIAGDVAGVLHGGGNLKAPIRIGG